MAGADRPGRHLADHHPAGTIVSITPDITLTLAGSLDTQLAAFFATVPAGSFITAWPENERNGYATTSQAIAGHARLYGLFGSNAPVSASYGQIVSAQSAVPGNLGYPIGPAMSCPANGGIVLDFYGMDIGPGLPNVTFDTTIRTVMSAMIAAGVPASGPWTLSEVSFSTGWNGAQNQWYSDGWAVAQAIGAIHFLGFFNATGDFGNTFWPPVSVSTLPVLHDIAALSRGDLRPAAATAITRDTRTTIATSSSSASLTATFTSNPAAGAKVLVAVQAVPGNTLTVTDNGATVSTFTMDSCCLNATGSIPSVYIYRADNITLPGAGTYAVTVAQSPAGVLQVAACAYNGVQNGPPSSTSAVTSSGNNPAVNPVTPADTSSLFFSAFFCDSANNPESFAVASPEFTLQQVRTSLSGTAGPGAVADAIVSSPAPRQGGWTLPDAPNWSAVMAAYGANPAIVSIVPGAQMVWAQAPKPSTGVTVSAGLAAATGTATVPLGMVLPPARATAAALPAFVNPNYAGLASAAGWAATNEPAANPGAGLAPGTAAALFNTAGSTISLTLTALNPVGATAAAQAPQAEVDVTAGLASATGAAPAPALGYTPGLASATGAALNATAATGGTGNAALATATGAANAAAATVAPAAGLAAATGAALAPSAQVAAVPGAAPATAAAKTPVASLLAAAGLASATGAALAPVAGVIVTAGLAAGTGAALNPTASSGGTASAGLASATAAALSPYVSIPSLPAATGSAGTPAAQVSGVPAAGAGTGAALTPAATVAVTAGLPAATGNGNTPVATVLATAGLAGATGTALPAAGTGSTIANAGLAAAAGAGLNATAAVSPAPAAATATGTALAAAVTVTAAAGTARATAVPPAPAPAVQPTAGLPAAAAAGVAATVSTAVTPGTAPAAGAGLNAAAFTSGAVFAAIAAAIAAAKPAQAPFTTGTLTTATSSSSLTATDQRTGGPG